MATETMYMVGMDAQKLAQRCMSCTHLILAVACCLDTLNPMLKGEQADMAGMNGPNDAVLGMVHDHIEQLA